MDPKKAERSLRSLILTHTNIDNEWISLASFFLHGYSWRNDGMIYDKKRIINGLIMVYGNREKYGLIFGS
jgi:hypothetical protein